MLIQKQYEQQQQMEAQDRSLRENIAQLREKLERERENFEKEKESLLEHRLKVSLAWPHQFLTDTELTHQEGMGKS